MVYAYRLHVLLLSWSKITIIMTSFNGFIANLIVSVFQSGPTWQNSPVLQADVVPATVSPVIYSFHSAYRGYVKLSTFASIQDLGVKIQDLRFWKEMKVLLLTNSSAYTSSWIGILISLFWAIYNKSLTGLNLNFSAILGRIPFLNHLSGWPRLRWL